ncbi:Dcp1p-Dcp2p decapping enzyme complex alpha subunit [Podila verticillata]|nr:Dcp1p-Dcp2p decapping enzyme complex alpha subunit [Podila verticillata]
MPKDYYGRGDYSDDESNSRSRDKFRRERSPDKDDFGRDKRRRKTSASPEERERRPKRNRSSSKDLGDDPGDRYIPNYDRDGYNPAPRYSRPDPYGSRYDHGGYGDYRGQRWQSTSTELQNRVVEVNYSPSDNTWRFFRFRDDKEHGNHSSVVQKVVQSIQDGVEREELRQAAPHIRAAWKERARIQQLQQQQQQRQY